MNFDYLRLAIILIFSVILSVQDIIYKKISNWIIISGIAAMLIIDLINPDQYLIFYLCNVIIFAGAFYRLNRNKTNKEIRIGNGDIIFSIFIGLSLRIQSLFLCFILIMIFEILTFVIIAIKNKKINLHDIKIPFIPYMAAGLIISFICQMMGFINPIS